MLIDRFVPQGDFSERHEIDVSAPAERSWEAVKALNLAGDPIVRVLLGLRGMRPRRGAKLADASRWGFVVLGEDPGVEIVLGIAGKFWRPSGNTVRVEADRFTRFDEPGYAKAAWSFRVVDRGPGRSLVLTHTRIVCVDAAAKRAFGRYWLLVRPFSGLIRTRALGRIKRDAERGTIGGT